MKTTILILALICLGGVAARTAGNACLAGQYSLEGKICLKCNSGSGSTSNGCVACTDGTKCTECADGWFLNDKGNCEWIHESCDEKLCDVSGTQACGKCADGYRPAKKDTTDTAYCVACSQGNCATCTVDECTECYAGFFLENKACTACSAGCAECTSATACTTCAAGFFSNAGACTACGSGCAVCTAADKCTTCSLNNILNSTTGACSTKDGCEEGDGADKCKTCRDGFRLLADGSCKACDSSAQTCDGSGTDQTILTCNPGLILATATATAKAACSARTDTVCLNQDAAGVCSKCQGTDYVISKGKCVLCASILTNCKTCQAGDATLAATCSACSDSAYATGSPITSCTPCTANCKSCTATTCNECLPGYFKSTAAATTCSSCDAGGAAGCTQVNDATSCKSGYGEQTHGICFKCDPSYLCKTCSLYQTCLTCDDGFGVQSSNGACVKCGDKCSDKNKCSFGPDTCSDTATPVCVSGYTINLSTHKCEDSTKCAVANCDTCLSTDFSKCSTCKSGFFVDNGACTACSTDCAACGSATASTCTECKNGKKLDLTTAAPTYCTTACSATSSTTTNWCKIEANGTTKTIGCKSGYVENTNKDDCITCSATNCVTCVANDGAKCATCKDNYFANASGVCTLCENTKVKTCTTATAALTCASGSCLGGAGGDKCFTCPANCVKTTGSTALTASTANTDLTIDGKCSTANLSCVAGYYKDASDVCQKCTVANCSTCTATACSACISPYMITSTFTCKNDLIEGCQTAKAAAQDKCSACKAGWFLNTSETCTKCSGGCTCTSATDCTGCENANQKYNGTADPKTCVACSVSNCVKCTVASDKCETCATGYFAEGDAKCTACTADCDTCTKATDCSSCKAGFISFTMPTATTTSVKFCATCVSNCKSCTVKTDGSQTCTECDAGYYLVGSGKSCSKADCSGSDGKACNKCLYGKILKDGKCADCTGDNSCPASCNAATTTTTGPTGNATNTTSATDSGSKIAFSLFVLAFFAILGHMMI